MIQADIWRAGLGQCALCGHAVHVDAHHVIPEQTLRRNGLDAYVMDTRNRLSLCRTHHRRHHDATRRLRRSELPDSVFEFARETGMGWWLEKHYGAAS